MCVCVYACTNVCGGEGKYPHTAGVNTSGRCEADDCSVKVAFKLCERECSTPACVCCVSPFALAVNGRKGVHLMMPKSIMDGMAAAAGGGGGGGGSWKSKVEAAGCLVFTRAVSIHTTHFRSILRPE